MAKGNVKKSLNWLKVLLLLATVALIVIFSARQIPIEEIRYSGGCGSEDIRLSLILDGQEKVSKAREEIKKMNLDRQERRNALPGLSDGCSPGLSYAIYIF
jgi:hypothetical protein